MHGLGSLRRINITAVIRAASLPWSGAGSIKPLSNTSLSQASALTVVASADARLSPALNYAASVSGRINPRCKHAIEKVNGGWAGWAQLPDGTTFETEEFPERATVVIELAQWANSKGYRL